MIVLVNIEDPQAELSGTFRAVASLRWTLLVRTRPTCNVYLRHQNVTDSGNGSLAQAQRPESGSCFSSEHTAGCSIKIYPTQFISCKLSLEGCLICLIWLDAPPA